MLAHYRIVSKIGAGGMGEVYLAQDTKLDRKVALKILPADVASNNDRMERFVREAKATAALNHPHIAQIFEIGEHDGAHFIAMEFVDGVTLREKIHLERAELKNLLKVLQQVAEGLSKAHAAGIVHRDLKPDNIMITRDGFAKVLDFGLAKLVEKSGPGLDQSEGSNAPTNVMQQRSVPGMVMGTVGYMSPEQAQGKTNEIDQRSDVFSFGCILFEAITGKKAFEGDSVIKSLHSLIYEPAPQIKDLNPSAPAELQRIVGRCLEKDADERYQTIKDVVIELKHLRRGMTDAIEARAGGSLSTSQQQSAYNSQASSSDSSLPTEPVVVESTRASSIEFLVARIQRRKLAALISLVVVVGIVGFAAYRLAPNSNAAIESIAVMPFVNASGNPDLEYLSDGMTETLIRSLSQLPKLNVKARSSVFRYKGKDTYAKTIGKELNVQAILNGRVVQRGGRLMLSLELLDAKTENVIWTDQYDRSSSDLASLQNEIARDVSSRLRLKLTGADQQKLAKNYTTDPESYRLYLEGRFYWNKRTKSEVEKAVIFFKQAIEKDPNFALGYVGLADSDEDNDRPTKKEYIRRALEIDDNLAEAHASLGYQYLCAQEWAASERELKRAMELNPNYPQAYGWNGARLMMIGKYDESLASIQRGLEIDPTSNGINFYKGVCLAISGRRDEAIQQFKKLSEMDPTFPWAHSFLSRVYVWNGNHDAAVEERAKSVELDGKPDDAKLLRENFASGGWVGFLRESVRQGAGITSIAALSAVGDSDKEAAIKKLTERAARGDFWLFLIKTDPTFDLLRGDPRFQEMLKKFDPPQ
jgi:serine/threonine-protein kinase